MNGNKKKFVDEGPEQGWRGEKGRWLGGVKYVLAGQGHGQTPPTFHQPHPHLLLGSSSPRSLPRDVSRESVNHPLCCDVCPVAPLPFTTPSAFGEVSRCLGSLVLDAPAPHSCCATMETGAGAQVPSVGAPRARSPRVPRRAGCLESVWGCCYPEVQLRRGDNPPHSVPFVV